MAVDNTPSNPYVTDVSGGDYRPRSPAAGSTREHRFPPTWPTAMGGRLAVQVDIGAPIG